MRLLLVHTSPFFFAASAVHVDVRRVLPSCMHADLIAPFSVVNLVMMSQFREIQASFGDLNLTEKSDALIKLTSQNR